MYNPRPWQDVDLKEISWLFQVWKQVLIKSFVTHRNSYRHIINEDDREKPIKITI